ncbi:MAG: mandelate racemase/muconate lactonizing enzyme family protein [Acidobacteria bacterium]|nr:mandelate racemase/muconate lactonizing enzyme family protein [Acidobacteriota bacterium]
MTRRSLLKTLPLGAAAAAPSAVPTAAAPSKMKIRRIRYYRVASSRPIFNQSSHIVTVETDQGITGIGEGGSKDMIEQLAGLIIGEDPFRTEHLWQLMYRHYFYPPGREKVHGLGAIDLALWDIKGKALGVPVYQLLGGLTRNYVECYSTGYPNQGSLRETARACIEAGFRAFRTGAGSDAGDGVFRSRSQVDETFQRCKEIYEGVGDKGDWAIDYHTRFDFSDAVRLSELLEPLRPLFCEDLVRSENPEVYRTLRPMVKIPIAVGEQFGDRWDSNMLIENQLIDYTRVTLPNAGGITEYMKLAALCETHYVGLVPHFTGPVAEASCVHCIAASPGPAFMEMTGDGSQQYPHLPAVYDFRDGKMWPNERPGLGVEFDPSKADLILEVTEQSRPIPLFQRPDGSITNW